MSRVLLALLLGLYLTLVGCAPMYERPRSWPVHEGPTFAFLRHVTRVFDKETALCIYGTVEADSVAITFLRPAVVDSATDTRVKYQPCSVPGDSVLFGRVRYLGMFHNHPHLLSECSQSATDRWSFNGDERAIIDLIGCADSVVVVSKAKRR